MSSDVSFKVQARPLLAVKDMRASTQWYKELLGLTRHGIHDHDYLYQQLLDGDRVVLQLHSWDADDHPNLTGADKAPPGHGVLVWFQIADFDAAVRRAERLKATIVQGSAVNPNSGLRELWLRDADGYVVVLASTT